VPNVPRVYSGSKGGMNGVLSRVPGAVARVCPIVPRGHEFGSKGGLKGYSGGLNEVGGVHPMLSVAHAQIVPLPR
jgi:hypothetical protein